MGVVKRLPSFLCSFLFLSLSLSVCTYMKEVEHFKTVWRQTKVVLISIFQHFIPALVCASFQLLQHFQTVNDRLSTFQCHASTFETKVKMHSDTFQHFCPVPLNPPFSFCLAVVKF